MAIQRKYVIAGVLAIVSIAIAVGYLQYKRLMDYSIGFKKLRIKSLTPKEWSIDIFLTFLNKASVGFSLIEQDYDLYVNNEFYSKITNFKPVEVKPKVASILPINIKFDPNKVAKLLKSSYATMILKPQEIRIKLDMKFKVMFWGFKVSISYVYEETLKGIIALATAPDEEENKVKK